MLIEFSVTNFLSIRETQTLTMSAAGISELQKNRFDTQVKGVPKLLRTAAIYGPNASGKSNMVAAMLFMKEFVETSSKKMQEGESIHVIPFLFEKQCRSGASEFEILFINENIRYQYGFSVTMYQVVQEWLFAYPEGHSQRWFERQFNEEEQEEISIKEVPEEMLPAKLRAVLKKVNADIRVKTSTIALSFLHTSSNDNELIPLDFDLESAGTQKLFSLAGPWLDVLEDGMILVIDEFDTSLHPLIARFLLELINDPSKSIKNAQLIFTTHDTTILDQELLRRDQIWFVEKDDCNSSQLYPLTDFRPRKGEALQKGYLQGRYGALPFVGDLDF